MIALDGAALASRGCGVVRSNLASLVNANSSPSNRVAIGSRHTAAGRVQDRAVQCDVTATKELCLPQGPCLEIEA